MCVPSWLTVSGSRRFALYYRPLSTLFWAAVRHFSLDLDLRRLAKWQSDDWLLCRRSVPQRKRMPVCSRADAWCDWVVLGIKHPPYTHTHNPTIFRQVVTMVTTGLVTCLEGERRGACDFVAWVTGRRSSRSGRRGGGSHTKTVLLSARPFTDWASSEGNEINSMK